MDQTICNFFDLEKSPKWSDQLKFEIVCKVFRQLFGVQSIEKDKVYRYSTKLETEQNHQFLIDNWQVICFVEYLNDHYKKNRRLVYWLINHLVDVFNQQYQFKEKITFNKLYFNKRSHEDKSRIIAYTYYDLKFT